MTEDLVSIASLAKKHGVSKSTVRRRVKEGKLFPGAKRVEYDHGQAWLIPQREAESVSLEDLSPRPRHQKQGTSYALERTQNISSTLESLDERIAVLERLLPKILAGKS
ncbi:hypothetical protein ACGFY9_39845 [Streptomyces sp. NPDC048504]|uniref:hypothetical protein n=1 Tax=Streptomyces sp. NPDC048504 TaxID=3365559 RepID=UPI00370FD584